MLESIVKHNYIRGRIRFEILPDHSHSIWIGEHWHVSEHSLMLSGLI
jgi:hypothetical protein